MGGSSAQMLIDTAAPPLLVTVSLFFVQMFRSHRGLSTKKKYFLNVRHHSEALSD